MNHQMPRRLPAVFLSIAVCGCAFNVNARVPKVQLALQAAESTANSHASESAAVADGFATLRQRLRAEYLRASSSRAPVAMRSLGADGQWSDIQYADRGMGEWRPIAHLERVKAMALAYASVGSPYHRSPTIQDGIVRALRAWLALAPRSDNWWHNTIGVQLVLMPILVVMDDDLPQDLRSKLLALLQTLDVVQQDRKTGQNLVWYATQQIVKGALTRNAADIEAGRAAFLSSLVITTREGLQADISFHQHGNQLYSGGYGRGFLMDNVRVAGWLQGTEWQFPPEQMNLLADFALLGIAPLVRGDWLDWSARGREITRHETVSWTGALRDTVSQLAVLVPARAADLARLWDRLVKASPPATTCTIAYWRSDFLAHQTPVGYFSVKMVSSRTIGTESGNGENLLGYWLPFGTTFIIGSGLGREYMGLQPLLDWSALPGTTAPAIVPRFQGYLRHQNAHVAVLGNETSGMASMQVDTQGLQVKKFWFVDGETMTALGTDIRYTGPQPVRTTLNQTRWAGNAESSVAPLSKGMSDAVQRGVSWLVHGGVGYLMLDQQDSSLSVETRRLIGPDPTTTAHGAKAAQVDPEHIMTLAIDHGARPNRASYAYAVVHGVNNGKQIQAMARPKVLANAPEMQGVLSADGQRMAVVLHQPGQIALGQGLALQADQAVAILGRLSGKQLQLQVIDLAGLGGHVTLRSIRNGHVIGEQAVPLPANTQRTRQAPAAQALLALER